MNEGERENEGDGGRKNESEGGRESMNEGERKGRSREGGHYGINVKREERKE